MAEPIAVSEKVRVGSWKTTVLGGRRGPLRNPLSLAAPLGRRVYVAVGVRVRVPIVRLAEETIHDCRQHSGIGNEEGGGSLPRG
jgi:hypothetical protein